MSSKKCRDFHPANLTNIRIQGFHTHNPNDRSLTTTVEPSGKERGVDHRYIPIHHQIVVGKTWNKQIYPSHTCHNIKVFFCRRLKVWLIESQIITLNSNFMCTLLHISSVWSYENIQYGDNNGGCQPPATNFLVIFSFFMILRYWVNPRKLPQYITMSANFSIMASSV